MTVNLAAWAAQHEVIVLEGCDGAGKTTVAVELARLHGYQLVHATRTPDGVDLAERYRNILAWPGRLVLDRCFVSELVYGPLLHGRSRLSVNQVIDLAAIVIGRGGLLVHLTAPPEVIAARLEARDGVTTDLTEIVALIDAYTQVFARLTPHAPAVTIMTS